MVHLLEALMFAILNSEIVSVIQKLIGYYFGRVSFCPILARLWRVFGMRCQFSRVSGHQAIW